MPDELTPRFFGSTPAADAVAGRYDDLAALPGPLTPRFSRTFGSRLWRLDGFTLSLTELEDDFHSMRVALRIAPDGAIVEAAGRMLRHPYDTCPRALESLRHLAGVNLFVPKASGRTKKLIPRTEGCLHVVDMLHIAYRAFWISHGHSVPWPGEEGRRRLLREIPLLRDTCVSYAAE